jgi:hypothetical protein
MMFIGHYETISINSILYSFVELSLLYNPAYFIFFKELKMGTLTTISLSKILKI